MTLDEIAKQSYDLARRFYKPGIKSGNKVFIAGAHPAKVQKRNDRMAAAQALPFLRDLGQREITLGLLLRQSGNTAGNCGEMASVAASFLWENHPGTRVTRISLPREVDHTFLILGQAPRPGTTVDSLRNVSRDVPSYVVDVWAGVCCHVSDYPRRFGEQMLKWQAQGKRFLHPERGLVDFNGQGMTDFLAASLTPNDLAAEARQHTENLRAQQATAQFYDLVNMRQQWARTTMSAARNAWHAAPPHMKASASRQYSETQAMVRHATDPARMALDYYRAHILATMERGIRQLPRIAQTGWVLTVPSPNHPVPGPPRNLYRTTHYTHRVGHGRGSRRR